jgi:ring-1,2-phenylacetyl-CoA epoxidase subunit PaaB
MKSFDPRVNRIQPITEKTELKEGECWEPFEVFHQKKRGDHHIHVGSVRAANAAQALLFAKEQYGRRQLCVNMWVVQTSSITAFSYDDADIFETAIDKEYREAYGFKVRDKINAYKKQNPST